MTLTFSTHAKVGLAACLALALGAGSAAHATDGIPMNNAAVAFLDTAFNQKKVQEAFDKYVGADYIQHNPHVATGKEAGIKALSGFAPPGSNIRYVFKRVLVDGDMVAIHSNIVHGPSDRGVAVVDIFRLDHGKVVEHWDVVQPVPDTAANPNTMF